MNKVFPQGQPNGSATAVSKGAAGLACVKTGLRELSRRVLGSHASTSTGRRTKEGIFQMAQLRTRTATDPSKGHGLGVTCLVQYGCLDLFFSKSPLHDIRDLGGCCWVEGREAEGTGQEDCKHLSATHQLLGHTASRHLCCSRAGAFLTASLLLLLATVGALLALVAILGLPPRTPAAQACVTLTNRTGFLCHDRSRCIPASSVCDGVQTCSHGEDEDEALCGNVPHSLPNFLVAPCGDPTSWIYTDQRCDGINNCGDCSDEQSPVTECLPCGPGWWPCPPTFYKYCDCIPRSLCRDGRQHCTDWSDENSCLRP
ncbi:low-density lipoprotein receptor class A domain-containing protein 1 [Suncus etruscus]|uniref:low-density lipoprotein receptor class A domain-containing protein 1 n=1 Tax=Suncus etruscus TaxID=109475 RepID=UPI00211047B3|nr:low-density lipoprotein receptor class A domain-containing protein 1 [Suncus etruscus]